MSDDNVRPFPLAPRERSSEPVLQVVSSTFNACKHTQFTIDRQLAHVKCRQCGETLDPMFVLLQLASDETMYHQFHKRYEEELSRLRKRQKTKCQHCKRITRISDA